MAGTIVKLKSGAIGRTRNTDNLVEVEVMDNRIPHMERVRRVKKVMVTLEEGGKVLCTPENLELIGYWD